MDFFINKVTGPATRTPQPTACLRLCAPFTRVDSKLPCSYHPRVPSLSFSRPSTLTTEANDKTKPVRHGGREDIARVDVEYGIPHVSVLSATLFLINVNSLNSGAFKGMLTGFLYDTFSFIVCTKLLRTTEILWLITLLRKVRLFHNFEK